MKKKNVVLWKHLLIGILTIPTWMIVCITFHLTISIYFMGTILIGMLMAHLCLKEYKQ